MIRVYSFAVITDREGSWCLVAGGWVVSGFAAEVSAMSDG